MKGINNTQLGFGRPSLDQVLNGERMPKEARNQAIRMAYREHKYALKDIATHLKMNPNYLCEILRKLET